ncbi:MAG: hypothetical protein K1X72_17660 [Pyrinomonadaceae bacterium]|nr:hypothetical protein [Pyrinomonadaceae bacterium]
MTENQVKQMINLMNKCVTNTQETQKTVARLEKTVTKLEKDVSELKSDVSELKQGQARMEKSLETNNKALDSLAGDNIRVKSRLELLEQLPH